MLRFFRTGNFSVLALLAALQLGLSVPAYFLIQAPTVLHSEYSLPGIVHRMIQWLPGTTATIEFFLAQLLIFLSAIALNTAVNHHRLTKQLTHLPALWFVLLAQLLAGSISLCPELMAVFFLSLMLAGMFNQYKAHPDGGRVFDLALCAGLATLSLPIAASSVLFLIAGVAILRPLRITDYLAVLFGFLLPFWIAGVVFFWFDDLTGFLSWFGKSFSVYNQWENFLKIDSWILPAIIGLSAVYVWRNISSRMTAANVQWRKFMLVAGLYFLLIMPAIVFSTQQKSFLLIAVPVIALIFGYHYTESKKTWPGDLLFLFLILTHLFIQFGGGFSPWLSF